MNTLQVGNTDIIAPCFNGHSLHKALLEKGVESGHCVWDKKTDDPLTWRLADFEARRFINDAIAGRIERVLSVQSLLYPFSSQLIFDKRFRDADVVHYQLIHTGHFSLLNLPVLTRMRPAVWTLHDPWALTGHCTYPMDCERWTTGCGDCPRLDVQLKMNKDRTAFMWKVKKAVYGMSKLDIVVASRWMLDMVRRSPMLSGARFHHIPFGIDLEVFSPSDSEEARRKLGVFPGSLVVSFRATHSEFKGFAHIMECLRRLKPDKPLCIITFEGRGYVDEFRGRYQIIDLGWVYDDHLKAAAYNASDVFLMPSVAEAFGMMAIEAMACGTPVVTFDGTSLPEVVFAPKGGIAVPHGDTDELLATLGRLLSNKRERKELGDAARELALQNYEFNTHVDRILELYKEIIGRKTMER